MRVTDPLSNATFRQHSQAEFQVNDNLDININININIKCDVKFDIEFKPKSCPKFKRNPVDFEG